ncbi:MAG: hypothetical protein APF76_17830 [Desulfitibacter sp. BRH_c19]|nr:MAG: hypothetical protein APF76_17830 [Desulfitibacter sp. BRH_c19]
MFETNKMELEKWFKWGFPNLVPIKQKFDEQRVKDLKQIICQEFAKEEIKNAIKPGQRIAVAVGSRGIVHLQEIVALTIANIKKLGGRPFIVPAMGSHGGATSKGQAKVLKSYGITESLVGAPVVSSMETVELPKSKFGESINFDKHAYNADGVILINRVKAHTDFKGPFESGLMKMLVIGLGKHKGAAWAHARGVDQFVDLIPTIGMEIIKKTKILFGLAILENAYKEIAHVETVIADNFFQREPQLLSWAKSIMGRIIPKEFDILLVEEIGKDISGTGMDTNVISRSASNFPGFEDLNYQRLVVFDLTDTTEGNACGIGLADITTRLLVNKINFNYLYTNSLTASILESAKIPIVMEMEKHAIMAAIITSQRVDLNAPKIVFIKNTAELDHILVTESLAKDLVENNNIEVRGNPLPMEFSNEGTLLVRPSQFEIK